jgi:AcrR family transcriptional regulator
MGRKRDTKEKILNTALDLFSESGYSATSIRQIAGKVGIREGGMYNHFKSKEELLKAILQNFEKSTIRSNVIDDKLLDEIDKPQLFMKDFSTRLLKHWNTEKEIKFLRLVMMEQFRTIEGKQLSMDVIAGELKSVWEMIFTQMVKHNLVKNADPQLLADEFISPLFFIRMEFLADFKKRKIKDAVKKAERHVNFFWDAIKL